jgi:hypothetical protein
MQNTPLAVQQTASCGVPVTERLSARAYRAIAEEDTIWVEFHDLLCWVVCRNHSDLTAQGCETAQDVVLDAKIVRHHLQSS